MRSLCCPGPGGCGASGSAADSEPLVLRTWVEATLFQLTLRGQALGGCPQPLATLLQPSDIGVVVRVGRAAGQRDRRARPACERLPGGQLSDAQGPVPPGSACGLPASLQLGAPVRTPAQVSGWRQGQGLRQWTEEWPQSASPAPPEEDENTTAA